MSTSPRPQKRTAHTCITCRARKVRCDGRQGICTNCERLGFACSYDDFGSVEVVHHHTATVSVPRRRARQACLNCHAKKARCSGSMLRCDRCRNQGLQCVYRPGKRSMPLPSSTAVSNGSSEALNVMQNGNGVQLEQGAGAAEQPNLTNTASSSPAGGFYEQPDPEEPLALQAFDDFFRHIHHIAVFSFLHRASLMERFHAGLLDRPLLLALIGITSLLIEPGPGKTELGDRCIDEAVALCMAELETPSIVKLQALVICAEFRILSKRFSSAFMLHALASRFATALRLNHESPHLCSLAQESRRRLMWSLYMIDSGIAAGQSDLALWADAERQIHIQLPCNERNFEFDLPEPTEPLRPPAPGPGAAVLPLPDVIGFCGLQVRIHWLHARILECTTKVTAAPSREALAALPAQFAELAAELETFASRLPLSFRWSESNLRLRTYSPRLGIFFMTHVWWRRCHLDLYRLLLPGLREALPPDVLSQLEPEFVAQSRRQCYEHARAMADMFSQLLTLGNSVPVTGLDLPGCSFQCVRVMYHGLQTAGDELGFSAEGVRELATICLRVARESTGGSACASIQADIEKVIASGLLLAPETEDGLVPTANLVAPASLQAVTPTVGTSMAETVFYPPIPRVIMAPARSVTHSHMSAGTSGSNAFEETMNDPNFGLEIFGRDPWTAFPSEWFGMGQFLGGTS
ncbi:sterol uptake control protein 2 [Diplogelasinospora grovesii]|uniref:Sterol uptake control protein 2 n=1 Tax=Diplogelasinospora grovesii TaxID=303347 RepID=A0AAN6S1X2_9PEZI|nr:sterol uptake control protein 2 [Diplogelasinospora grovesii]